MQTTIEQTDYIGQQAQLTAIRYLADKQRQRELKRMAHDYYIMTGIALFYSVIAAIAWVRV
jgi:TnpA family transposase